jgi:hypothetical protein
MSTSQTPSVLPLERSRVLPRVSFRMMLSIVTLAAVVAFTLRLAWLDSPLALAIIYSLTTLAICFALFAILFLIAWIPAVIGRDQLQDVQHGSPFAVDQLPPQLLPPREPGT